MTSLASRTQEKGDDEHPYVSELILRSWSGAYHGRFYAGLGTVLDFHDSLISFAYDRQVDVDSSNGPYYLESLQGIAEGRKSEDLQTKVAIEASNGKVSLKDVREAYKAFGFEFEQTEYDEDTIIGTFQSRIADAPRQESALRRSLTIIGQHRNSPGIQQIASNSKLTPVTMCPAFIYICA